MRYSKSLTLGTLTLAVSLLSGCFSYKQNLELKGAQLPVLSKDEIASVNGNSLTLSTFLSIRSNMKEPSIETAYWIGVGGIVLLEEAHRQGKLISGQTALEIARYAVGDLDLAHASTPLTEYYGKQATFPAPSTVRTEIEGHMNRAVIMRNSQILSLIY